MAELWALFVACDSQWNYVSVTVPTPSGGAATVPRRCGIPAERVEVKARGHGVPLDRWFWSSWEILEAETIRASAED